MSRENIDLYNETVTIEDLPNAVSKLRLDFDSHIHDGTSSRTFEVLYAKNIIAQSINLYSGTIKMGQTAYDTGIGFWLGEVSSTVKLSIGNSAGNKLLWDGTNLTITGNITGSTITGGTIQTAASGQRITMDSSGMVLYDSNGAGIGGIFSGGNIIQVLNSTYATGSPIVATSYVDSVTCQLYNNKTTAITGGGACIYALNNSLSETVYLKNDNASNTKCVLHLKQDGTGGHIRTEPVASDPTSGEIGDLAVVGAATPNLKICTAATPTWTSFMKTGDATSPQFYKGSDSLRLQYLSTDADNYDEQTITCGFHPRVIMVIARIANSSTSLGARDCYYSGNCIGNNMGWWFDGNYSGQYVNLNDVGVQTISLAADDLARLRYNYSPDKYIKLYIDSHNDTSFVIKLQDSQGASWTNATALVEIMVWG